MMNRFATVRLGAPLLLGSLIIACDIGPSSDRDAATREAEGPAARWERDIVFLPGEQDDASAAGGPIFLSFQTFGRASSADYRNRGWLLEGDGWQRMFDESWSGPPARDPWRILPQGPLRVTVGLDDDLEALFVESAEAEVRIEPGPFTAEWAPAGGAQIVLREADIVSGDEARAGWMVDARFTPAGAAPARAAIDGASGEGALEDASLASDDTSAASDLTAIDSSAPAAMPQPRRLAGALTGTDNRVFVLGSGSDGTFVWMWSPVEEGFYGPARLTSAADGTLGLGMQEAAAPTGASLGGSLTIVARSTRDAGALLAVRGSLDVNGTAVPVSGVVREPE